MDRSKDVDRLVLKAAPETHPVIERLRVLIARALPDAQEFVKWKNPVYMVDGKNVAWILFYKDHVNLGFFKGAKLKSDRLEGTGKGFRHIKVFQKSDIDEKEFTRLLKEALPIS